jgi:hypothetical protein
MNARQLLKNAPVTLSADIARSILANVPRLRPESVQALANEMIRARLKFPKNTHLQVALAEEVGELAKAHLEGSASEAIQLEALQVACVAMRIYEEGDRDFEFGFSR